MKLLITGAGTVGSAVGRHLVEGGHDVTLFDLTPPSELGGAAFLKGDVRDASAIRDAADGVDGVIHTVALHLRPLSRRYTSQDYLGVNVIGTYNVLEAAAAAGVERVVHCSTLGVTDHANQRTEDPGVHAVTLDDAAIDANRFPGVTDYAIEQTEDPGVQSETLDDAAPDADRFPGAIYGFTKTLNEYTLDYFHATAGLDVVALRFGAIWEYVQAHLPDHSIEFIASNAITGLSDVVGSIAAAMLHPGRLPRRTYTVVARPLVSAEQLQAAGGDLRSALIAAGRPDLAAHAPASPPRPRPFFDMSRTEQDLGFAIAGRAEDFFAEACSDN